MTIIKNIINSAKKTWRGEEDPVKVFYTWGLACYIILPLFTAGLGCLSISIVFLRKIISNFGVAMFIVLSPVFMLLLVAPLITYILCSRNIHNVKAKNIKVKKRIVRGLLFDINNILSFILLIILMALTAFGTPLVFGYPLIYFILFALFIVSNAYRYYKYYCKYQIIFNEKLINFKVPAIYHLSSDIIKKIIQKLFSKNIFKKQKYGNKLKKFNIKELKYLMLELLYLLILISLIFLIKNIY